jgi:ribosomal protein L11 methyltransferase
MDYIELNCKISEPHIANDIFIAWLGELGFESFVENEEGLLAYIPVEAFSEELRQELDHQPFESFNFEYAIAYPETINWNQEWENNYPLVNIDGRCVVRAPFHEPIDGVQYEIVIEPKMSFGTAHHETTSSVMRLMFDVDFAGKKILDMGSGTGVLAILAHLMGAESSVAIDIDEWAYLNCVENFSRNNIQNATAIHGIAKDIPNQKFDIIFANINRNILLEDMHFYVENLPANGIIIFSGFYEGEDFEMITNRASELGLSLCHHIVNNRWVAAQFQKQ